LSVREVRAQIVHGVLLADPAAVEVAEDIARLARLATWSPAILAAAVDDLVAAGRITDDAHGRLQIHADGGES